MKYQDYCEESKEQYGERLEVVMERIAGIAEAPATADCYREYFMTAAAYQLNQYEIWKKAAAGQSADPDEAEARLANERLYLCFRPDAYETSYANYAYAAKQFGEGADALLTAHLLGAFLSALPRNNGQIAKGTARNICIYAELFVEICYYFEEAYQEDRPVNLKDVQECMRSFMHDYAELFLENSVASMLDPEFASELPLLMEADLSNTAYLYRYGQYISDNERESSRFLASLSEEEIRSMADTMSEGYRIGFHVMNKDISRKSIVRIIYPIGFERMIRAVVQNYRDMGFACTFMAYGTSVNQQMDYDHREDDSLWTDKEITEYKLECYRNALEKYKETAPQFGGPDCVEVFGEEPFSPIAKKENPRYTEAQQKLSVYYRNTSTNILNKYIHGEERSFSIIAYPIAEIGPDYKEIFAETVKLNTLDYMVYREIQQKMIDEMDTGDRVHITGCGDNRTDLTVNLWKLKDPSAETIFENCVADVNIPLGEVFTTPVLEGTNGLLHVTEVYLEGLLFKDLELEFTDGMITSYSCRNFDEEEDNRRYIEENILFHHKTLPMGEFAIGTNTVAYKMAQVYGIAEKMPILIAEKTGPHFAVGDTCYCFEEDSMNYNPDGKAVVARENTVSALRHEDLSKAYLNCHTDITIPYDELGAITVIRKDGSTLDIIRDGRFVLPGCELLNQPLDELA